jgi:excisionase family DNA binding protein
VANPKKKRATPSAEPSRPLDGSEVLMSKQEAANYLGVTKRKVERMIAYKEIEYVKLGKLIRIRKSVLEEYVERQTVSSR